MLEIPVNFVEKWEKFAQDPWKMRYFESSFFYWKNLQDSASKNTSITLRGSF